MQFNDTLVPEFQYPHYGNPDDVFSNQYPVYRYYYSLLIFVRDMYDQRLTEIQFEEHRKSDKRSAVLIVDNTKNSHFWTKHKQTNGRQYEG